MNVYIRVVSADILDRETFDWRPINDRVVQSIEAHYPEGDPILADNMAGRALGQSLMQARVHAGVSLETAAEYIGLSKRQLSKLEKGEVDPQLSTVIRYAQVVGVKTTALLKAAVMNIDMKKLEQVKLEKGRQI